MGSIRATRDTEAYALLGSEGWNARAGIDTGVFLIRNSPFIRELLDTLERQARILPMPSAPVGHFKAQGIHRTPVHGCTQFMSPHPHNQCSAKGFRC